MTDSERLLSTLEFGIKKERGAVLETFFPWNLTVDRWCGEGLPEKYASSRLYPAAGSYRERYLQDAMTEPVYEYEQYLGFDGVKRMAFRIPFSCFEEIILEDTREYILKQDIDGWQRKYYKNSDLIEEIKPAVQSKEDWYVLKEKVKEHLLQYCTDEAIHEVYGKYRKGHLEGNYSIRFRVSGFFWTPRTLLGIEEQMYAFYDMPDVLADMNRFITDTYKVYLGKIFEWIQPEVLLFEEDLSGSTGPMISPAIFEEFVAAYYKQLFPYLKEKGVKNIFVDTDGDFNQLIPGFLDAGVDGFLPMDVNAGMDIVKVREQYPKLKFIGGFNKLKIEEGKEAIDMEFERILPVIRQGGYVPGCDHQVSPGASLENYRYYIGRLKEIMEVNNYDI